MEFKHVKVIEKPENQKIAIKEGNLWAGPMNIQEIEWWEGKLIADKTPYVLAQVDTTVGETVDDEKDPKRFTRGYCLFIAKAS